jgi:hypothetical protein
MTRFLIEGLGHDDGWIMVEDEFYAIAQTFTQHLHYAEYVRRKKEAKAQSAAQIDAIARPTDGRTPMSKELKQRKEAEALAARQEAGLEQIAGQDKDDTDDDNTWAGTHLHGLMASPRKSRSLAGLHALKSSTRAAAGFGRAPGSQSDRRQVASGSQAAPSSRAAEAHRVEIDEETASSEDDDLDGRAYATTMPSRRVESRAPAESSEQTTSPTGRRSGHGNITTSARPNAKPKQEFKSKVEMLFDDFDELPEPSRSNTSIPSNENRSSSITQGREVVTGENNLESKKSRYKDVPTFLV